MNDMMTDDMHWHGIYPQARIEMMPAPGQDLDDPPQLARMRLQANNYLWSVTFPVRPDGEADPADLGRMLRALADAVDPPRPGVNTPQLPISGLEDAVGRYMRAYGVGFPEAVEAMARARGLWRDKDGQVVPFVPRVPPAVPLDVPPEEPPEGGSAA